MDVSLLILTRDRRRLVERCFQSLEPLLRRPDLRECLVLDNASSDDTPQWLRTFAARHPNVQCHFAEENLGVAKGRDWLIRQAQAEAILLLDSDIVVTGPAFLDGLKAPLANGAVGLVGVSAHWIPRGWQWPFQAARGDYHGQCDAVPGFCQLFRRSLCQTCSIDLRFNPYWLEDTDFSLQVTSTGHMVWAVARDTAGLAHDWGKSGARSSDFRSRFRYLVRKWKGKGAVRFEREGGAQ